MRSLDPARKDPKANSLFGYLLGVPPGGARLTSKEVEKKVSRIFNETNNDAFRSLWIRELSSSWFCEMQAVEKRPESIV